MFRLFRQFEQKLIQVKHVESILGESKEAMQILRPFQDDGWKIKQIAPVGNSQYYLWILLERLKK